MTIILGILFSLFGGLWRRTLGGSFKHIKKIDRKYLFGGLFVIYSAIMFLFFNISWIFLLSYLLIGIGFISVWTWPGHGETMDMGKVSGGLTKDYLYMTGRYIIATTMIATGFALIQLNVILVGITILLGALPAFGYYLGWKLIPEVDDPKREKLFFDGATSIGEFISGIAIFGSFILNVIFLL